MSYDPTKMFMYFIKEAEFLERLAKHGITKISEERRPSGPLIQSSGPITHCVISDGNNEGTYTIKDGELHEFLEFYETSKGASESIYKAIQTEFGDNFLLDEDQRFDLHYIRKEAHQERVLKAAAAVFELTEGPDWYLTDEQQITFLNDVQERYAELAGWKPSREQHMAEIKANRDADLGGDDSFDELGF
jgi:hypothetical protein